MADVIKAPMQYRHRRTVRGREIYDQPYPPDEMIWELCPYVRPEGTDGCLHCPRYENDPDHGPMSPGCYVFAAEACRVVFACIKRHTIK